MIPDDLAQAVLSREDVVRYLRSAHGGSDGRERVFAYLEERSGTEFDPALVRSFIEMMRQSETQVSAVEAQGRRPKAQEKNEASPEGRSDMAALALTST